MAEEFPHEIAVIADEETCTGFRLAGVQNVNIAEGRDAEKKLEEMIASGETGIIIVNEKILVEADWRLKKKIEGIAKPAIVAVPDKAGPSEDAEKLQDLIKKALGFELIK